MRGNKYLKTITVSNRDPIAKKQYSNQEFTYVVGYVAGMCDAFKDDLLDYELEAAIDEKTGSYKRVYIKGLYTLKSYRTLCKRLEKVTNVEIYHDSDNA